MLSVTVVADAPDAVSVTAGTGAGVGVGGADAGAMRGGPQRAAPSRVMPLRPLHPHPNPPPEGEGILQPSPVKGEGAKGEGALETSPWIALTAAAEPGRRHRLLLYQGIHLHPGGLVAAYGTPVSTALLVKDLVIYRPAGAGGVVGLRVRVGGPPYLGAVGSAV